MIQIKVLEFGFIFVVAVEQTTTMFFSGDSSAKKRVDLGGRSSKERDRQKLLEQTRLERNRRLWLRQQNSAALKIQVPVVLLFNANCISFCLFVCLSFLLKLWYLEIICTTHTWIHVIICTCCFPIFQVSFWLKKKEWAASWKCLLSLLLMFILQTYQNLTYY